MTLPTSLDTHSAELARALCVSRQIQSVALDMESCGFPGPVDRIEALASVLSGHLEGVLDTFEEAETEASRSLIPDD